MTISKFSTVASNIDPNATGLLGGLRTYFGTKGGIQDAETAEKLRVAKETRQNKLDQIAGLKQGVDINRLDEPGYIENTLSQGNKLSVKDVKGQTLQAIEIANSPDFANKSEAYQNNIKGLISYAIRDPEVQFEIEKKKAEGKGQGTLPTARVIEEEKALGKASVPALIEEGKAAGALSKFRTAKDRMLELLDTADTGFGAEVGTTVSRALEGTPFERLSPAKPDELAARTELGSLLKDQVIQGLANFKGAISDKEREFLEKGAGAITMTKDELKALIEKAERGFESAEEEQRIAGQVVRGFNQNSSRQEPTKQEYSPEEIQA